MDNPVGANFTDFYLSSSAVYLSMALAPVYVCLFVLLLSKYAHYIAWIVIAFSQVGLFVASYFLLQDFIAGRERGRGNSIWEMVLSIALFLFGIVYSVVSCCALNEIKVAIYIVDAVADYIYHARKLVLVPLAVLLVTIFTTTFWILCMGSMNSVGEITADPASGPQFKKVQPSKTEEEVLYWMNITMVFGLLWIWSFKSDFIGLVSMISAATYYFDSNEHKSGHADVKLGLTLVSKYHLGSVALGSFVIPLMTFFKIVIVWPCHQIVITDTPN